MSFDSVNVKKCLVVFGVYGSNLGYNDFEIDFTLHFYNANAKKQLYPNIPHNSQISKGDYKYYSFYVDDLVENLYISLSNMNGDADLLLNYGNSLPTMSKSDWSSKTTQLESIDINIDDEFFKVKKTKSMAGNYTVGVYSFTNTTFTLFYSTQKVNIIHLDDSSAMSCSTKTVNETCYFNYAISNAFENNNYYTNKDLKVIFSTDYSFGNGVMFTKLYNDHNVNDKTLELPSEDNYDDISKNNKMFNLHKIYYSQLNPKLMTSYRKPTILVGVKCFTPCQFSIQSAKEDNGSYNYLDNRRDNLLYIGKNSNSSLTSYITNQKSNFAIKRYEGRGTLEFYYLRSLNENNYWKYERTSLKNYTLTDTENSHNIQN